MHTRPPHVRRTRDQAKRLFRASGKIRASMGKKQARKRRTDCTSQLPRHSIHRSREREQNHIPAVKNSRRIIPYCACGDLRGMRIATSSVFRADVGKMGISTTARERISSDGRRRARGLCVQEAVEWSVRCRFDRFCFLVRTYVCRCEGGSSECGRRWTN